MIVLLGIGFALAVLVVIVVMLLRRRLREKYATLWLVIGLAALLLAAFPALLEGLAKALGVEVPSNLLFALSIVLLVGVSLHLSWELSTAEDEVRRVAEDIAISSAEIEDLRRRVVELEGGSRLSRPPGAGDMNAERDGNTEPHRD